MAFTPKDWKDYPDTTTPITSAALENLETRVTDYTDDEIAALDADQFVVATEVDAIVVCTQTEYNGLTPDAETLYVISG